MKCLLSQRRILRLVGIWLGDFDKCESEQWGPRSDDLGTVLRMVKRRASLDRNEVRGTRFVFERKVRSGLSKESLTSFVGISAGFASSLVSAEQQKACPFFMIGESLIKFEKTGLGSTWPSGIKKSLSFKSIVFVYVEPPKVIFSFGLYSVIIVLFDVWLHEDKGKLANPSEIP